MKKPVTIPELASANPNALTIWVVLQALAAKAGKRQVCPSRERLGRLIGRGKAAVSRALHALDAGGWITLRYGQKGKKTWFRITLPDINFGAVLPPVAPSAEKSKRHKRRPARRALAPTSERPLSKERVGTDNNAPLEEDAFCPLATEDEHPATRIERERLAEIRRRREAAEANA